MSKTLHLSGRDSDLASARGAIGRLCEFAPDSPWVRAREECYGPETLLGSPDTALAAVYPLVSKLLETTPRFEGFPPLSVFEEPLLEQFSYIAQAVRLDHWITEHGFSTCHFVSYTPWLDRLRHVQAETGSRYEVVAELPVLQSSGHGRALRRLWKSRPDPAEFFRRVTPLWSRCLSGVPDRKPVSRFARGGIWFYSTAYNYTKIGLEYEPYLPSPMHYVVEDPATGGQRLRELKHDWHRLYAWARTSDVPSRSQIRSMGKEITDALLAVPLSEKETIFRAAFLRSEWWQLFLNRRLPFLIFNSRVLRRWYESVEPEMILIGNAGYERALLLHQEVRRVPVLMLQHGVMHWVYGVADQPVDLFLLRGPFFQRVLNERLRSKTVIQNFPEPQSSPASQRMEAARDSILFITTPYEVPELFHVEDRRDILRSLLRASHTRGRRLVIRVHPMEKIASYQRSVAELQEELGAQAEVSYSQGPGVEDVLARSCVAVLYFSTMFLDCLRHQIPIVSFDWHWFPNKRQYAEAGIFNFASDLQNLESLVEQGVNGKLPLRRDGLQEFLTPTDRAEVAGFFQGVCNAKRSAAKSA